MLNMRRYPKYSGTSFLQCSDLSLNQTEPTHKGATTEELRNWACTVAKSRGINAVLRVGGGEIWDEVYRNMNMVNKNLPKPLYHIVGGAAGTVGAAGGYMGATGLAGTTGMRLFGYAADQVVQMEMVLPSGDHVRFSPTEWVDDDQLAWPRTTKVTGWCNSNPVEDETKWLWEFCPQGAVNFEDLWHSVRGGGNGFGVVTSIEYQLPNYPGPLVPAKTFLNLAEEAPFPSALQDVVQKTWANFLIDSQWNPSAVGMTEEESNLCGGPNL
eukprot:4634479-Ditylum_brightwellii.AAC.1